MNKKITRRVVLGAVFSALAAGPFVVRWLRSDRGAGLSEYSEIAVKEGNYGSDLSPGQVESAFDYLIKERSRWLKFRGVSGRINVSAEISEDGSTQRMDDLVTGLLDVKLLSGGNSHGGADEHFPERANILLNTESNTKRWEVILDRVSGEYKFDGKPEDDSDVPYTMAHILTLPTSLFANLPNNKIIQTSGFWEIHREDNRFSFLPSKTLTGDHALMPEFVFVDGLLRKFSGKKVAEQPYPVLLLDNYVFENGFGYPVKQTYYFEGDSSTRQVKVFVDFLEIAAVVLG